MIVSLSIHHIYRHLFKIWRKRRFRLFIKEIAPKSDEILLDVGGYPGTWIAHPPLVSRIDSLNIHHVNWDPDLAPGHNIHTLVGDGCRLDMTDNEYDIAFSNSVIEHVGNWTQQVAFASEIRRVGQALWIQTPAKECPIEPHYLAPLVHYLPKSMQKKIIRWITIWGLIQKPAQEEIDQMVETTRLLTRKEMTVLFPDCRIHTEYLLWIIPKSYVAIRKRLTQAERALE